MGHSRGRSPPPLPADTPQPPPVGMGGAAPAPPLAAVPPRPAPLPAGGSGELCRGGRRTWEPRAEPPQPPPRPSSAGGSRQRFPTRPRGRRLRRGDAPLKLRRGEARGAAGMRRSAVPLLLFLLRRR